MKKDEVIPSIAWIIIGIIICVASAALKLGSWRHPQPGLFAFLIGCGMIALSVFHMIPQLTKKPEEAKTLFYWEGLKRIIIVFVLLVFYVLSLERLGFLICTYVFFVAIFKSLGRKSWGYAILTSLIVTILSYIVFDIWLKVNLPKGPLRI